MFPADTAVLILGWEFDYPCICLLYTSDAADEEDSVDLGGRRVLKKKKKNTNTYVQYTQQKEDKAPTKVVRQQTQQF